MPASTITNRHGDVRLFHYRNQPSYNDTQAHFKVAARLNDAVETLRAFETPDQLAAYLTAEGITGYQGDNIRCPVSRWLRRETGWQCRVAGTISISHTDGATTVVHTPGVVRAFYIAFDADEYPALIDMNRCMCSLCRAKAW